MLKKIDWRETTGCCGFPCKDCDHREPACHDSCEEYKRACAEHWKRTHICSEISNYASDKAKQIRDYAAKYAAKNRGRSKAGYD